MSNIRIIPMTDANIRLTGRIDLSDLNAPLFIYPCSGAQFRLTGRTLRIRLDNRRVYFDNRLGVIVNGVQTAIFLAEGEQTIDLSYLLKGEVNDVLLFKRQDCCHAYRLQGLQVDGDAALLPLPPRPVRRMEVYGDSVSAGEVSEAEFACGQTDPEGHNGRYSNSYYSYAWQAARLLNAELHDHATGGIALLNGTGYFNYPDFIGLESAWDKLNFYPALGNVTPWDFGRYTPHVVVAAVGQNDHNPVNVMAEDDESDAAQHWRNAYRAFLTALRGKYPNAQIVCATTILGHHENWDKAIHRVVQEMGDGCIHHFLYTNNGCGTPGHVRGSEAAVMARELADFIESLPQVWED